MSKPLYGTLNRDYVCTMALRLASAPANPVDRRGKPKDPYVSEHKPRVLERVVHSHSPPTLLRSDTSVGGDWRTIHTGPLWCY